MSENILINRPAQFQKPHPQRPYELLVWAAPSTTALHTMLSAFQQRIMRYTLPTLSYKCWQNFQLEAPIKLAIISQDSAQLQQQIAFVLQNLHLENFETSDHLIWLRSTPLLGKIALLFPGHGAQYPNMLRDLVAHFPIVQDTFHEADSWLNWPASLTSMIYSESEAELEASRYALRDIRNAQPAIGVAAIASYRLLQEFGIVADMVGGHSYGEYIALYAASVYDAVDLVHFSAETARTIADMIPEDVGGMIAIQTDAETANDLISDIENVWVANLNAPTQTIIAGTHAGLLSAQKRLNSAEFLHRTLNVAAPFHTPLVTAACTKIAKSHQNLPHNSPLIDVYANSTATQHHKNPDILLTQMEQHFAHPVRYIEQIETMYADGARLFIECGPRDIQIKLVKNILGDRTYAAIALDSPKNEGVNQLLKLLAQLLVHGVPIHLTPLFAEQETQTNIVEHAVKNYFELMQHFLSVNQSVMLAALNAQ